MLIFIRIMVFYVIFNYINLDLKIKIKSKNKIANLNKICIIIFYRIKNR